MKSAEEEGADYSDWTGPEEERAGANYDYSDNTGPEEEQAYPVTYGDQYLWYVWTIAILQKCTGGEK